MASVLEKETDEKSPQGHAKKEKAGLLLENLLYKKKGICHF